MRIEVDLLQWFCSWFLFPVVPVSLVIKVIDS